MPFAIDRFAEYSGGQIVISGQVSPLMKGNVVYVGRTSDHERLPEPVAAAEVTLFEEETMPYNFREDPDVPGKYVLPEFQGTPGKSYHIQVTLQDGSVFSCSGNNAGASGGRSGIFFPRAG